MTYDEIVEMLRYPFRKCQQCPDDANYDACELCIANLFREAADAIEKLQADRMTPPEPPEEDEV